MASFIDFLKLVFIPAIISLVLYVSSSFFLLPFVRRHRHRYDQYLPVHNSSDSISNRTSSVRDRIADTITAFVLPSFRNRQRVVDGSFRRGSSASDDGQELFGIDEGEDMASFDVRDVQRRREELRRDVAGLEESRAHNAAGPIHPGT